ncbi:hypothetical protein IDG70_05870, partial [Staphylococcus sp. EG-SA-26]|nr:hypothetical protein [Staphylococcus sp. EG-SA-26]
KGYNYTSVDSSYASTYNDTNKTVKMTNAGQSVTYYFTDVKAPPITAVVFSPYPVIFLLML